MTSSANLARSSEETAGALDSLASEPGEAVRNWRPTFVSVIAVLLFGLFAIVQISSWPNRLLYPGEEDAAEGTQLSEMVHLRRGIQIYRLPSGGEFDGAVYGPLCYLTGAALIDPDHPSYLPLRLLSLCATISLVALCALFVWKLTHTKWGALLAPLLVLGNAYVGRYGISARADMVALLLAFTGFLVFFCYRESRRGLMLSAFFMLLSIFYKQQFIGAPISVMAYLAITRQFRNALQFVGTLLLGGLLMVGIFTFVIFPHQAFLLHFITFNHLPFNSAIIVPELLMFVVPLFVPLLGSADFVDRQSDKLLICYTIISSAVYFLLLASSGSGADTNRCLEAVIVLSCFFAAHIATVRGLFSRVAWTVALAFTLTLVTRMSTAFVVPKVTAQDFLADAELQKYLRQHFPPGTTALSYYPADPLRAGLSTPITNWWHYSALIRRGLLSDRDVVSRINRGEYGVVLLDFDLNLAPQKMKEFYTTRSVRDAILGHYCLRAVLFLPQPEMTRYTDAHLYVWEPSR